jgi:hypothetical protein
VHSHQEKYLALSELKNGIPTNNGWWVFPDEHPIRGFMGTGDIFIVGDQPSREEWGSTHPNRRIFYDTIKKVGLANAHLTDLYKKQGRCSELKNGPPPSDFDEHLNFLRKEIEILKPKLIVALGALAQRLLIQNLQSWKHRVPRIWHFSYVKRAGKESEYEKNIRQIIFDEP